LPRCHDPSTTSAGVAGAGRFCAVSESGAGATELQWWARRETRRQGATGWNWERSERNG